MRKFAGRHRRYDKLCETCHNQFSGRKHQRFCSKSCSRVIPITTEERFWEKVQKTSSCWIWVGGVTSAGYGSFGDQHGTRQAHNISYEMANGPIPPGLSICHRCDIRRCVNPEHLFAGTHADNMRDAQNKGRMRTWYRRPNFCGLGGDALIAKVVELKNTGLTQHAIADQLGIGPASVSNYLRNLQRPRSSGT